MNNTPKATRLGDLNTGHDACPPAKLETGSEDVFINDKKAGRVKDKYVAHACSGHPTHQDEVKEGSSSVFINSRSAARVKDPVILAGEVAEGSNNVFIGG